MKDSHRDKNKMKEWEERGGEGKLRMCTLGQKIRLPPRTGGMGSTKRDKGHALDPPTR